MKGLLFAGTMLLTGSMAFAQQNISGTWFLKEKKVLRGPEYSNAVPEQIAFKQLKDSVTIIVSTIGQNGEQVEVEETLSTNGKPVSVISPRSGRKIDKSATWSQDKKNLIVTSKFHKVGSDTEIELTRVETVSLAGDGKSIVFNRKSIETESESWEANGTYDKK